MDRAVEAPDELSPVHDTETWSGSESHAESYCSQDEAYYGGAENEPQEGEQFPHIPNALLGWKLRDHRSTEDPELSLSDYSQEGDPPGPLRYSPAPHHDVLSGSQVDSCPCTGSEDEDSGILYSKPFLVSESIACNLTCREPPASGSSCPDQAVTLPRPGKQSPLECSDSLESEEEGKEEGGGDAAPPAPHVSGGIQTQGAERTELWEPASLNGPDRARRHRERHTRLRRSEGESEKHLKEVQSKCKCIALLLTAAPDPKSKGVLMFKKRRQRARKFTLVSYGTGKPVDNSSKDEYSFAGDGTDQNFRFSSPTTSASEIEEDSILEVESQGTALNITYNYNPLVGGVSANHNWEAMEQLPQTKGKGVLMFAKRRQRIDEIAAEHEEMRRKGIPVESFSEHEVIEPMPVVQQGSALIEQDVQVKQQVQYQEQHYQLPQDCQPNTGVNGLDPCSSKSKSLVPNRTAKPFLGGLNQASKPFSPVKGVPSPTLKKPENIFKVPIPVNTSPQVWSPTGDIIASRDERIAVPAIKTGILPEIKRRGANKSDSREPQEEDHLSLGAEACNFMQVPTVKQKNPPPILPKPAINPACPPWSTEGHTPRSPLTPISPVPVQAYSALPQQNWAPPKPQPQSSKKPWAPSPSQPVQQQNMPAWLPPSQSTSYQATWTSEPQQAPMSIQTPTVSHAAPPQSKVPWTKPQYQANSVASCPPRHGSSYFHSSKAPPVSPRGHASETEFSDGPALKGKGAELFARRQTRMEKFVVDTETVQANKARPSSPTLSVPSTWKYSPNIRAPPPVSYNPIVSPFYPLAAQKQPPPATSPKIRSQANKEQPKPKAKHLSVVDVMKHQPYQLDSSLFTYNYTPEMKAASPKLSPVPPLESKQSPIHTPNYLQSQSSGRFPSPTLSPSPVLSSGSAQLFKPGLPVTPGGPVYSRSRSMSLPRGHSSVSTLSPVSSPSFHSAHRMPDRQMSWVERPQTPFPPWETTARSTLGLVDEVYGSGHRKSLPEASLERKPQMSSHLAGRPQSIPPAMVGRSLTKASSPASGKTATYGPPFRPAQPLPGDTMDLGKKLSTPKDIMLEELSLLSNRGSRLFKMRQRRSEKYTFESIQNEANSILNNEDQANAENAEMKDASKTPPNTPNLRNAANPEEIAPGYGGPLKDVPPERFNSTALPKSYHSPWEQAIINDPALADTLQVRMPVPEARPEMPDYRSFNRVATPYGGFDKAPRGITFKIPEIDLNPPRYPELQDAAAKRPTFNRTAQGWISDGLPLILPTVPLEPPEIPESDDL